MSILKSTNTGGKVKLTIENLRARGWDWGLIAEPMHTDLDFTKLVRDFQHEDECLRVVRSTKGNPNKYCWFYAKFHKETGPEDEYNWDVLVYPSNFIELAEIETFWNKLRKQWIDPVETFKYHKNAIVTAIRKK